MTVIAVNETLMEQLRKDVEAWVRAAAKAGTTYDPEARRHERDFADTWMALRRQLP
jgi:hypothetical protein